jgi:hypothetical protein
MLRISAVLPLVLATALPASGATLGGLARTKVPALWEAVVTELQAVREDALPHETKDLRKQIGKLRDHIDLFAPVYGEREGKDL